MNSAEDSGPYNNMMRRSPSHRKTGDCSRSGLTISGFKNQFEDDDDDTRRRSD